MEKKCVNCELMDICKMHAELVKMGFVLNANMALSIDGKTGFTNMVDNMAHDCKRFKVWKESE